MHTDEELIECKTVLKGGKRIVLEDSYLEGLYKTAMLQDRSPIVDCSLPSRDWVVIPKSDFLESRDL